MAMSAPRPAPASAGVPRDLTEYLRLFEGVRDETAIGEATTSYLRIPGVAERIRNAVPDAKLIVMLRNPVDRAFSRYAMLLTQGIEKRPFADVVAEEMADIADGAQQGSSGRASTASTSAPVCATFPAAQLHVHLFEDLRREPQEVVRSLFEFLDVDRSFVAEPAIHNDTQFPARSELLDRLIRRTPERSASTQCPSCSNSDEAEAHGSPQEQRHARVPGPVATATRGRCIRDDIGRTEQLIGRDLSGSTRPETGRLPFPRLKSVTGRAALREAVTRRSRS